MRRYGSLAAGLLFLASTTLAALGQNDAQADRRAGERRANPEHVDSYLGDVLIRTDGARIFVMVDTILDSSAATDGLVDQWFILEAAEPLVTPVFAHLSNALIVHSPGAFRVTSPERRFDFALPEDDRNTPGPNGATHAVGIGLSHNTGETSLRIADQLDLGGKVSTFCKGCEVLNPDPDPSGSAGSACPPGGAGATSCSSTHATNRCSVTCASGYYACCNALPGSASCKCVRN